MRTPIGIFVCLLVFLCPAAAEEQSVTKPAVPLATQQVADRAKEAVESEDLDALRALAERNDPDPWLVADLLCSQGELDAARAFAVAASRPGVAGLGQYVESRRDKKDDAAARTALYATARKIRTRDTQGAYTAIKDIIADEETIVGISVLYHVGLLFRPMRRLEESSDLSLRAARAAERWGWTRMAMRAYDSAGIVHRVLRNRTKAVDYYERALRHAETLDEAVHIATTSLDLAYVFHDVSDYMEALPRYERALVVFDRLRMERKMATTLNNIGRIQHALGDYGQALAHHHRALRLYQKIGNLAAVAGEEINIGVVHADLANYAKALDFYERGLRDANEAEQHQWAANALSNIGGIYWEIGDPVKARDCAERALERMKAAGRPNVLTAATIGLGLVHAKFGDHQRARSLYEKGLEQARALGQKGYAAGALGNLGRLHIECGENEQAVARYEEALAAAKAIGDRVQAARYEAALGSLAVRMGRREAGLKQIKKTIREARRLRARSVQTWALGVLARIQLEDGDAEGALASAREALGEVEHVLGGLGEDDAASLRSRYVDLFATGTLAAARLDEPAEAVTFLESGRAGALLEALGGRKALRWTDLSSELRRAELEAKRHQETARIDYQRAIASRKLGDVRAKAKVLDAAALNVRAVADRIQREAKGQAAGFFYPRAATIEELRQTLGKNQALVLYGLCLDEALALVLTRGKESLIPLGTVADVTAACNDLSVADTAVDPTAALARLEKLLIAPLALPASVTEVIVSPEGPLCQVPFGALCRQPVALAPSGSTHVLLTKGRHARGTRVLALGDPVYGDGLTREDAVYARGQLLRPLPFTRAEVNAVGDEILLGAEASEMGLRATLLRIARWRSVHFACHGLVDPERPTLSSLALSRTKAEDGFLTALEVLRMEIPTDLAVLSACETGRGKVVTGEGILGLTRAFMYAGASRVICSLWKVDDEATQALMIRFYELWNPKDGKKGLGAAAALKKAQEFIKGHEKWEHPYYWAAWVLWGLPN